MNIIWIRNPLKIIRNRSCWLHTSFTLKVVHTEIDLCGRNMIKERRQPFLYDRLERVDLFFPRNLDYKYFIIILAIMNTEVKTIDFIIFHFAFLNISHGE